MDRRVFTPKWLLAHVVVLAMAALFVGLGLWQLDRLQERKGANTIGGERYAMDPVPFESLEHLDPESIEYRRVTVAGRVLNHEEVLIRSQVHLGAAGYHLILPISHRGASEVLINRGWVPLGTQVGAIDHGAGEDHVISLQGWIHLSQERPPLGPVDPPDGVLQVMSRVDIERFRQQANPGVEVANVYIVEIGERGSDLPVPIRPPEFAEDGPHLGYAIQWFGFAVVLVVGYVFLARRRLRTSG